MFWTQMMTLTSDHSVSEWSARTLMTRQGWTAVASLRQLHSPSAKTSVLAHAVFDGPICWFFLNMLEFKFHTIEFHKSEFQHIESKTGINSMFNFTQHVIDIQHVENKAC
jgi:hypothetical protein